MRIIDSRVRQSILTSILGNASLVDYVLHGVTRDMMSL